MTKEELARIAKAGEGFKLELIEVETGKKIPMKIIYLSKEETATPTPKKESITLKDKLEVESAEIVWIESVTKPYYEIKYKKVGNEHYNIGYGSYNRVQVEEWLNNCFTIVKPDTFEDVKAFIKSPSKATSPTEERFNKYVDSLTEKEAEEATFMLLASILFHSL